MMDTLEAYRDYEQQSFMARKSVLRQKLIAIVIGFTLALQAWNFGGVSFAAQLINLALAMLAFYLLFVRLSFRQPDDTPLRNYRRLIHFPLFWIGLVFMSYLLIQFINPSHMVVAAETPLGFDLQKMDYVAWLPSGIKTDISTYGGFRISLNYFTGWLCLCTIWAGLLERRFLRLSFVIGAVSGMLMSLVALVQEATGAIKILWYFPTPNWSFVGTFIYPNHAAGYFYLLMGILSGLALYLMRSRKAQHWQVWTLSFFCLLPILVFMMGWARAAQVGTMVMGLCGVLVIMLRSKNQRRLLMPMVGAIIVAGGLAMALLDSDRFLHTLEDIQQEVREMESSSARYSLVVASLDMFEDKPVYGSGPGSFQFRFPEYQKDYPLLDVLLRHPDTGNYVPAFWRFSHNDWVQFLVEHGMLGGLILFAAVGWVVLFLLSHFHSWMNFSILPILSLILFSLHALVDFLFYSPALVVCFSIVLGVVLTDLRLRAREEENQQHW